jgi:flagellar protein FlbD
LFQKTPEKLARRVDKVCGRNISVIQLTRINHVPFYLNAELIEHVESTPDTVITLTNGQKYLVEEAAEEVVRRFTAFRRSLHQAPLLRPPVGDHVSGEIVECGPSLCLAG